MIEAEPVGARHECNLGVQCRVGSTRIDDLDGVPPQSLTWTQCFLCAKDLTETNRSDEHVFPKWLLSLHNLWNERLTLPNGTLIPYRQLTIPCCVACNSGPLSRLEEYVAGGFADGYVGVAALDRGRLGLWLAKLQYGMLFRDLALAWDRRNENRGTIVNSEWIETFRVQHLLLQAIRGSVVTPVTAPFSVLLFRCQTGEPVQRNFDYRDSVIFPFAALRSWEVGLVAVLQDWGKLQLTASNVVSLHAATQLRLNPDQFTEVVATVRYTASLTNYPAHLLIAVPAHGPVSVIPVGLEDWIEDFGKEPSWPEFASNLGAEFGVPVESIANGRGMPGSCLRCESRGVVGFQGGRVLS